MFYATLMYSDKAIMLPTGFKNEMELIFEAACELFGSKENMVEKPGMIALINTVSPLSLDERMLDCLMLLAEYGQPAILCPATMLAQQDHSPWRGLLPAEQRKILPALPLRR